MARPKAPTGRGGRRPLVAPGHVPPGVSGARPRALVAGQEVEEGLGVQLQACVGLCMRAHVGTCVAAGVCAHVWVAAVCMCVCVITLCMSVCMCVRVCAHVGAQLCVTPVAGTVQVCTVAIHAASPGIGHFGSVARGGLRPPSPFSEPSRMPTGVLASVPACACVCHPGAEVGVPICPDTLSHLPGCPSASESSTERDPGPCGRRSGRACDRGLRDPSRGPLPSLPPSLASPG